ncbi:hypothetical protein [Natronorarus salvus]|uniref:hypothetical protein n=1 Tax=Natronorarus salvus TaxID=3117733 RepID=UPI002F2664E5
MAVEPWKLMLGLAGLLVVFAIAVSVLDASPLGSLVLVALLVPAVFFGYRLGRRIGPDSNG